MSTRDKRENSRKATDRETPNRHRSDRRDVLKKTLTVGGITVGYTTWVRPQVETVLLPAHAQTTANRFVATLSI